MGLQIGTIREGGLYMPVDEATQVSKGFAFIEFSTPQARCILAFLSRDHVSEPWKEQSRLDSSFYHIIHNIQAKCSPGC